MSNPRSAGDASTRPLRVLVVSMWPSHDHPERGIFVRRQVDALRRLGCEVEVARLTDVRSGSIRTPLKYLLLLARARRLARRTRPDVVHGHFLLPTGAVARMVARARSIPYIVTAHGTDVRNAETSEHLRRRTAPVVDDAACVIAVSDPLADRLRTLYPSARVEVGNMGVASQLFTPAAGTIAGQLASGEGPRLVAVASLLANKNQERLLRAVAAVPGARIVLIGDGPDHDGIEALIADLGIHDRAALRGRATQSELADWYQRMDASCLVSLDEGFGLAVLESLACGCPVIVSRTAPAAQLVEDGVTGVIVDPLDVDDIARGIRVASSLHRLPADRAAKTIAGHTVDDQAARLKLLLDETAGRV